MPDFYIHYKSRTMHPCGLTDAAQREAEATWLCPGCKAPKPGWAAVDAHLDEGAPDGPLNFVGNCRLPLAELDFLLRFGLERVERDLLLGRVFGPTGEPAEGWVTFRGRRQLLLRGTEDVQYRRCPECGRPMYFALGALGLCPHPPPGVELFESQRFGLIVPEPLAAACDMLKPRGVYVERLPVLDEPLDGLPVDLG